MILKRQRMNIKNYTAKKSTKQMDYKRNIQQEIKIQKKWVEIGKATLEQVIEEGQPDEIIECEREQLKKDEAILEQLLKEAEK